MAGTREVVITGLGVVSPIGIGREAMWDSLLHGRSGVGPITRFDAHALPVRIGAELRDFEPKQYVKPRKSLKVMSREIQAAFAAASLAVEDAGMDTEAVVPERFGVVFGSEIMYCDINELADLYRDCLDAGKFDYDRFGTQFRSQMYPLWLLKYLPNMAACHIGIAHDARGPNNSIVLADVSSLVALSEAARVIERGAADVMIAGGTGCRLSLTALMYRGDSNLSHCRDDPATASRPFDAERDGMVNGEGAAAIILESRAHAQARGATVLARVLGHGAGIDTCHSGRAGRSAAIEYSIRAALQSAGVLPADVSHVNAHGLSTVDEDASEAMAIRQGLGDTPVTAPKSYFGNLGAAGGALETAVSVMALHTGIVPQTLNYTHPDPECPVNVVREAPLQADQQIAVVLNQTGAGQAAAVVLGAG